MKREFKVTFSSLEEAWFDNEAIVIAETEEEAFNLVKDCIDSFTSRRKFKNIEKAQSSSISKILEIEIDALDSDVFRLLELLNSSQIISIKDFIDYDAKFLYGESVSSKWNQFKNFIHQSGVKYITLTKNGNLLSN